MLLAQQINVLQSYETQTNYVIFIRRFYKNQTFSYWNCIFHCIVLFIFLHYFFLIDFYKDIKNNARKKREKLRMITIVYLPIIE